MKINWIGTPSHPGTVDELIQLLGQETLDPRFENYGNFLSDAPAFEGGALVWGNFFNVSHGFSIEGTPEELRPLFNAIRANQDTAAYKQIKADLIEDMRREAERVAERRMRFGHA